MLEQLGLEAIRLDLPFRLNHVNVFIAEEEDGCTIIDAGLHNEETVKAWKEALNGRDVSRILITHYHPDHFGYAGQMQKNTGAKLSMSETDATSGTYAWTNEFFDKMRENYSLAGIPDKEADEMRANTETFVQRVNPLPQVDHYFQEGEKIVIGGYEYEILFTPGHSDGLIVFYNQEKNVLLSTDHVLPKITPNISYWFHGRENPLEDFMQSLKKIEKLDIDYVIPSHGRPFRNANKRIEEIRNHHWERLEVTLSYLQEPASVYEVCGRLFPKILTTHEIRFAIGETLAHLEYLRHKGECKRKIVDGKWLYSK